MRLSTKGKTVYAEFGFWLEKDGSIHLAVPAENKIHVAINRDPERRNGHPTLYEKLAQALRDAGAPAPELE